MSCHVTQVSFNYLKVQWTLLDPSLKEEWGRIEALRPGEEVVIVDRSTDEKVRGWLQGSCRVGFRVALGFQGCFLVGGSVAARGLSRSRVGCSCGLELGLQGVSL
jgi:predicted phage tail protein